MSFGTLWQQGLVSGGTAVLGISLAEGLLRRRTHRQRLQTLAREIEPQLVNFRQLVCAGGPLAVSPGSAQGQTLVHEVFGMFGMLAEMILLAPKRRRKWKRIRGLLVDLDARCHHALSACLEQGRAPI